MFREIGLIWRIPANVPYLSTNHHRKTLPISSANSTKTATRTAMNSSFVSLCAATSLSYALSSSQYGRLLADAELNPNPPKEGVGLAS